MSRRIKRPINRAAYDQAELVFRQRYATDLANPQSQQPGTKLHRKLRDKWLDLYKRHGGEVEDGKTFADPLPNDIAEPCPIKNEIVEVEFLDGDDQTLAAGEVVQHVNLPRDAKFVGSGVTNIDRLGRKVRVRIRFARAKKELFKVALLSHEKNAAYTSAEKVARPSFNYTRVKAPAHAQGDFKRRHGDVVSGKTRPDGTAIVEFEVTPAGGDKYKLVAWDVNGNKVHSASTIKTTRTVYYATFLGDDPNNVFLNQAWFRGKLEAEYRKHHVNLVFLGQEQLNGLTCPDPYGEMTSGDPVLARTSTANGAFGRKYDDYKPYLICFTFVDHIAQPRERIMEPISVDNVQANDVVDVPLYINNAVTRATDALFDWRKPLWRDLGDPPYCTPAPGSTWFKSARMTLHHLAGDQIINLAEGDLTLVGQSVHNPHSKCQVQVTAPATLAAPTRVTVEIEAVYMSKAVSGQALSGKYKGIAVMPARVYYALTPRKKRLSAIIHEAGHILGMCPNQQSQGLQHATYYNHNGQHCHESIPAQPDPSAYHLLPHKDTGTCIMYGLIPDAAPNMKFCKNCRKLLRKIDLGNGLYL